MKGIQFNLIREGKKMLSQGKPYSLWLLAFVLIMIVYVCYASFYKSPDAKVYLTASTYLLNGQDFYGSLTGPNQFGEIEHYAYFLYSPFFALLLAPLTFIPQSLAILIWQLGGFFLFGLSLVKFREFFPKLDSQKFALGILFSLIFIVRYLGNNIELGQTTLVVFFLAFYAMYLIHKRKFISGGSLLALGINIKILPIVFLPYLIYRGYFKATLYVLLFTLVLLFLPALYLGFEENFELHKTWFLTIDPGSDFYKYEINKGLYNISAFTTALFSNFAYQEMKTSYNYFNFSSSQIAYLSNFLRAIFIFLTLYFLRSKPFRKEKNSEKVFWEWSYLFLTIPLIFPRQSKYAFIFLLPSIFYLLGALLNKKDKKYRVCLFILLLYFALSQLTSMNFVGREFDEVLQFSKLITYASFLLTIGLAIKQPDKESRQIN